MHEHKVHSPRPATVGMIDRRGYNGQQKYDASITYMYHSRYPDLVTLCGQLRQRQNQLSYIYLLHLTHACNVMKHYCAKLLACLMLQAFKPS